MSGCSIQIAGDFFNMGDDIVDGLGVQIGSHLESNVSVLQRTNCQIDKVQFV